MKSLTIYVVILRQFILIFEVHRVRKVTGKGIHISSPTHSVQCSQSAVGTLYIVKPCELIKYY